MDLLSIVYLAVGAGIFYCGFIAGRPKEKKTEEIYNDGNTRPLIYECPPKLEPAPKQESDDEIEVNHFYQ